MRAVIPVVAGMFAMRQLPFQVANIASAIIWAAGVIAPSFYLVVFKDQLLPLLREHELIVSFVLFVLAATNSVPRPFLFLPTLILFAGIGALHIFAGGNFLVIWLAGAAGAMVGDMHAYITGKRYQGNLKGAWPWTADASDRAPRPRHDRAHGRTGGDREQVSRLQSRSRAADGGSEGHAPPAFHRRERRLRPSLVCGAAAAGDRNRPSDPLTLRAS